MDIHDGICNKETKFKNNFFISMFYQTQITALKMISNELKSIS